MNNARALGTGGKSDPGLDTARSDTGRVAPRFSGISGPPWEYSGVLHCHSHFSDGAGSVTAMVAEADKLGLDFLLISDHNTLMAKEVLGEGWYGPVLVLIGEEITPQGNHFVALGTDFPLGRAFPDPEEYLHQVRRQGGVGFLAHPHDRGNSLFGVPPYPWSHPQGRDCQGMEIWNLYSDLGNAFNTWGRLCKGYLAPWAVLEGPHPETLDLWDRETQRRRFSGIGSADAHGVRINLAGTEVVATGYRWFLRQLRTRVLLPEFLPADPAEGLRTVQDALTRGSCFVSLDGLGAATGFRFWLECEEGQVARMGEQLRMPQAKAWLKTRLPARAKSRLICNGQLMAEYYQKEWELPLAEPGVYRVEAFRRRWRRWRPWIFSNPIYVRSGEVA